MPVLDDQIGALIVLSSLLTPLSSAGLQRRPPGIIWNHWSRHSLGWTASTVKGQSLHRYEILVKLTDYPSR